MQIVVHRVNTVERLQEVPTQYGIEFDVREGPSGPWVTHDAWTTGVPLDVFLAAYSHAFAIVNIKCEGIEPKVQACLARAGISKYMMLDCSFPMLVKIARQGDRRLAVRLSEFESIETVLALSGMVDWVWVDVFTRIPVTPEDCARLKEAGFQLCLVSPELQGRPDDILPYKSAIGDHMDMVCTKTPTAWLSA